MKRIIFCLVAFIMMLFICTLILAESQEQTPPEENIYTKSLHYTNKGIEYLYSKEQGGVERITGISASDLGCLKSKCHVKTCDTCHKKEVDGKAVYSKEQALSHEACMKCHPVEKDDPDIHFKKGMKCMDCHSAREIHSDGVAYNTYMQPGFFDARCEKCHDKIQPSASHTIHKSKVDCSPCHVREFINCLNCHYETRLKEKKDVQLPVKDLYFLVNHDGKVTTASFLTHVYKNKTMITFGPYFSHSIMKEGRKCKDCHDTSIVQAIKSNTFNPIQWEKGEIKSITGVIPVLDGMKWNLPFLNYEDGKWTPLQDPAEPLIHYSGYCSPLTKEQFTKLEKAQGGGTK